MLYVFINGTTANRDYDFTMETMGCGVQLAQCSATTHQLELLSNTTSEWYEK